MVENGQLSFIGGGWCMNDEGTTYYEDIYDQFTLGHQFLLKNFNYIPKVGWQVDTFGHSSTQALISELIGFDALFLGRIHYEEKLKREKNKELEMIWKTNNDNDGIFTKMNNRDYRCPKGFFFDSGNWGHPIFYQNLEELKQKANKFASYFLHYSKFSQHPTEMMQTIGEDFAFREAFHDFDIIEKYIDFLNSNNDINMHFKLSHPHEYIDNIHKLNFSYPIKIQMIFSLTQNYKIMPIGLDIFQVKLY